MSSIDNNCYIYDEIIKAGGFDDCDSGICGFCILKILYCLYGIIILLILPCWLCILPLVAIYYLIKYGYDGYMSRLYLPLKNQLNSFKWKNPNK